MFTAKDQVDDKWAGFEAGADDYLTKPTDPEELDRRIQVLLKRASQGEILFEEDEPLSTVVEDSPDSQTDDSSKDEEKAIEQTPSPASPPPQQEEIEIISNLVAVVGVRGGVGTTTVAINLAASLADNAGKTQLIDLDMEQGHVALYLQQKIKDESLNDMSRHTNNLELARQWKNYSLPQGIGLDLLLSRANIVGEWPVLTGTQTEVLLGAVASKTEFVVVDIGRGLRPTNLPVIHRAGHIFVCIKPERLSLLAAKHFLDMLKAHTGNGAKVHVLMATIGQEISFPKAAVEEFIQHELMATIPISYKEMANAVNKNTPLVRMQPASNAAEIFRNIVDQIAF
jgi:pilus assembly protein CpaE